jgi:hypothetical protein
MQPNTLNSGLDTERERAQEITKRNRNKDEIHELRIKKSKAGITVREKKKAQRKEEMYEGVVGRKDQITRGF